MLKQMFKLGSLVAICGTLLFTGCEQMDADIALSEDFNPTERLAFGVAGHEGAGPRGHGGGEKGGPRGFGKCFELVFPVIAVMLSAIKINNKESSDVKRPEFAG